MTLQPVTKLSFLVWMLALCGSVAAQRPSASPADRERVRGFLSQGRLAELSRPIAEGFAPVFVVDKFDPITDAPVAAADEVQVTDGELVLGVVLDGEARAYPINMLTGPEREVVNDTLGGQSIAATWCHLCNSAVVYDQRVDGRVLTFAVSGMLWRRNLVMYDVETDSLWAQFNGKAMQGELIGTELDVLPGTLTTWGEWRSRHSGTTVLDMSRTATAYKAGIFEEPERFVYGWNLPGRGGFHIGVNALQDVPVRNVSAGGLPLLVSFNPSTSTVVLASRRLEDRTLHFTRQDDGRLEDAETQSVWDAASLEALSGPLAGARLDQLVGMFTFRDAWTEFHPQSEALE